jgi:excisionase family DNA binding protein
MAIAKRRKRVPHENRVVMSIPEAGERLDISRDAAYRAAKAGDIPTIRIGGSLKVPVVQLERLLNGK